MDKRKKNWVSYANVGPGGLHCPCCGPSPGEDKRRVLRAAKRRMRQAMEREIQDEIDSYQYGNPVDEAVEDELAITASEIEEAYNQIVDDFFPCPEDEEDEY